MHHSQERRAGMTMAILGLWANWAVAVGILTVLAFLAPIVPQYWLVPIDVLAYIMLYTFWQIQKGWAVPACSRLTRQVSVIVIVSGLVMAVICILTTKGVVREFSGEEFSKDSPFLAILITAPVTAIVTAAFLLNRYEPLVCRQCKMRYGNVIEHGFVGGLYRSEWRFQTRLLLWLSLALSVVDWGYYIINYVNVSLNRADYFFFIYLPLAIYLLSLIYLGSRYWWMWVYYCHNDEGHYVERPGTTTYRFLLIYNDCILIDMIKTDKHFPNGAVIKRFDTPVKIHTDYHEKESLAEAQMLFRRETGISDADIRLIYTSPDPVTFQNIFHYFAFINDPQTVTDSRVTGEWMTVGELMELIRHRLDAPELRAELIRIYDIAMTWKTYDRDGKRLYPIKHYKPTFRLRDLHKWDVDYDDPLWLHVRQLNEDKPFFHFRRFFSRIGRGIQSIMG